MLDNLFEKLADTQRSRINSTHGLPPKGKGGKSVYAAYLFFYLLD